MGPIPTSARTFRRSKSSRPYAVSAILVVIALASLSLACGRGSGSSAGLEAAYQLGVQTSATALEAFEAQQKLLDGVKFEPVTYQRTNSVEPAPSVTRTCGVRYQLSAERWGIVPELTYACDDEQARKTALNDARTRLGSQVGAPASDYDLRLLALQGPANALRDEGSTLVYARALGVDFNLESCVDRVSRQLAESAGQAAILQCGTFVNPGPALKDFRTQLDRAAERAQGITMVAGARPAVVISSQTAARCQAQPGAAGLAVPGSVTTVLSSPNAAYAIRVDEGQNIQIDLRADSFDTTLRLYDRSCERTILSDDDGGEGTNSRIRWTPPVSGEYVVVATSINGSGRGTYTLSVTAGSIARAISEQERETLQSFIQWVKKLSDEELLAAWRANSGSDLQLGCLNRERYESEVIARARAQAEATSICMSGLKQATEARRVIIANQK